MKGKLYLVGTPIGNLADITFRAIDTLKSVDVIACEDTRHTLALLNKYEIKKPLISYYKQKENEGTEKIEEILESGKNVALVTDAGMPCISDPGAVLVKRLLQDGYEYTVIPGATAVTSAAALVGIEKSFTFVGFLPEKNKQKDKVIKEIENLTHPIFLYSAPHDVNDTLEYLYEKLGERKVYLVKEITKIYENVTVGDLKTTRVDNPRGEYVLVVDGKNEEKRDLTEEEITDVIKEILSQGNDKKTAINILVEKYGIKKNLAYKLSLEI